LLCIAVCVGCALGLSSPALAQQHRAAVSGAAEVSYDELIREALSEFNLRNFAEARALFERAHALEPNARTLRGLGITAFELKRYVRALSELQAALDETHKPLTEAQRNEVRSLIAKSRRFVGEVKLAITPEDASVAVDGRPSASADLVLDLGEHDVVVRASGYRDAELKLLIDGGENTTQRVELVRLDLNPERVAAVAPSEPAGVAAPAQHRTADDGGTIFGKWWFWTTVGAVVVGGSVTALAVASSGDKRQPLYEGSAGSVRAP
jgi:hypothetical protein